MATQADVTYICDLCHAEFSFHDECEEHLSYNHDLFDRFMTVDNPQDTEPETEITRLED